jgi:hypothetical protein
MSLRRGIAAAALCLCASVAQDVRPEQVERVLARHECQTRLPGEAAGDGGGPGGTGADASAARGERSGAPARPRPATWQLGMPLPPVVTQILLWTTVAVAVAVLIASIVRGRGGRRAAPSPAVVRATAAAAGAVAAVALPDPERLASAGDFGAAVRAQLQHAFAAWVGRGGPLPLAATGREVLRLVRARAVPVEPLARLVGAVEQVHFGGRDADRALYEASRDWLGQWEATCRNGR